MQSKNQHLLNRRQLGVGLMNALGIPKDGVIRLEIDCAGDNGIPVVRITKAIPQDRLQPALKVLEEFELVSRSRVEVGTLDKSVPLKSLIETIHRPVD